ncbi:hypothetical protein [Nonomuraea sp. NPDC050643]|uniref:hypothetical protein n=1 Tax=Nonomuraea sp. NPDC050643 TaxID=3155660 RepID=UPI003408A566
MTTVEELRAKYGRAWDIQVFPYGRGVSATRRAKYTQDQYDQGLSYGFVTRSLAELAGKVAAEAAREARLSEPR